MSNVVKLASSRERAAVRGCDSCAHRYRECGSYRCGAVSTLCVMARAYSADCGPDGRFWEPKPPRQYGIFERGWRFLFGGRP